MRRTVIVLALGLAGLGLFYLAVPMSTAQGLDLAATVMLMGLSCLVFAGLLWRRRRI